AKSPVRTLDAVEIDETPAPAGWECRFRLRARSFLHNQVRGIVGTLERVGRGAWPPERVGAALAARDRAACGPVCPPDGLYLLAVRYPRDPFAPEAAAG
ncbi:MAG TPA: tRNA pseudouridine(38-40) synthase TruA, partial [Amaricoccus sp.]|nr:tRNA pseudouridine(38-40) synthase TruA [Amaricoccus sp.]